MRAKGENLFKFPPIPKRWIGLAANLQFFGVDAGSWATIRNFRGSDQVLSSANLCSGTPIRNVISPASAVSDTFAFQACWKVAPGAITTDRNMTTGPIPPMRGQPGMVIEDASVAAAQTKFGTSIS
jgi:hypothetical protein